MSRKDWSSTRKNPPWRQGEPRVTGSAWPWSQQAWKRKGKRPQISTLWPARLQTYPSLFLESEGEAQPRPRHCLRIWVWRTFGPVRQHRNTAILHNCSGRRCIENPLAIKQDPVLRQARKVRFQRGTTFFSRSTAHCSLE